MIDVVETFRYGREDGAKPIKEHTGPKDFAPNRLKIRSGEEAGLRKSILKNSTSTERSACIFRKRLQ